MPIVTHYGLRQKIYWTFAEHITDVLDSVSMDKELQALFNLGKHYATSDVYNPDIDGAGFEALKNGNQAR